MGIDIYMRWKNQTEKEKEEQLTGFSVESGHVGYLREAYHGGPYATHVLVPESFDAKSCKAKIPAKTLRERLPDTLRVHVERELKVYKAVITENAATYQAFVKFVELAEKKEKETGEPVTIIASY